MWKEKKYDCRDNLFTKSQYLLLILCSYFNFFRNTLNEIYFGKTRDIVNGLRSVQPLSDNKQQEAFKKDIFAAIANKGGAKD